MAPTERWGSSVNAKLKTIVYLHLRFCIYNCIYKYLNNRCTSKKLYVFLFYTVCLCPIHDLVIVGVVCVPLRRSSSVTGSSLITSCQSGSTRRGCGNLSLFPGGGGRVGGKSLTSLVLRGFENFWDFVLSVMQLFWRVCLLNFKPLRLA